MSCVCVLVRRQSYVLELARKFSQFAELRRAERCCTDSSADRLSTLNDFLFHCRLDGSNCRIVRERCRCLLTHYVKIGVRSCQNSSTLLCLVVQTSRSFFLFALVVLDFELRHADKRKVQDFCLLCPRERLPVKPARALGLFHKRRDWRDFRRQCSVLAGLRRLSTIKSTPIVRARRHCAHIALGQSGRPIPGARRGHSGRWFSRWTRKRSLRRRLIQPPSLREKCGLPVAGRMNARSLLERSRSQRSPKAILLHLELAVALGREVCEGMCLVRRSGVGVFR